MIRKGTRNIFSPWPNKAWLSYVADVEPESTLQACRQQGCQDFKLPCEYIQYKYRWGIKQLGIFLGSIFQ